MRLVQSRSCSRESLVALARTQRQIPSSKSLAAHPLPPQQYFPRLSETFKTGSRDVHAFLLQAPPRPTRRETSYNSHDDHRPSSPFPLLARGRRTGNTRTFGSSGDVYPISVSKCTIPTGGSVSTVSRAKLRSGGSRRESRAVVEAVLEGDVLFTNPWLPADTSNEASGNDMIPDSDVEPERAFETDRSRKKTSVASTATAWTSSSEASSATAATTVSSYSSPTAPFSILEVVDPLCILDSPTSSKLLEHEPLRDDSQGAPRNSEDSDARPETYYTANSRSTSIDILPPPVSVVGTAQIVSVPFPSCDVGASTAPASTSTFMEAEAHRQRHMYRARLPPALRLIAPSPSPPSSPDKGKRRSFFPLPAIPRIAPLELGLTLERDGVSSLGKVNKGRHGLSSAWFD